MNSENKGKEFADLIAKAIQDLQDAVGNPGNENIIVDFANGLSEILTGNKEAIVELSYDGEDEVENFTDMLLDGEITATVHNSLEEIMEVVDMLLDDRAMLMEKNAKLIRKIKLLQEGDY